ncbi:MAG: YidC/Oxa1 family membrane protein insertase [Chloroflexi bacterium]|nr:YidC/Oxa1 family membrane protein insertase [Chloroflexota bacterium]
MLELITVPFINIMVFIYSLIGNFGLAIILFTLIVRLSTYPFTAKSLKSAQAMQEMQGSDKYQKMQKKYKNDKEKLSQEQMKLYQEMGINPLGSCLPSILQMLIIIPVFYAVSRALAATPLELMQLHSDLVWIPNASELIPLNSQFLWMDLGQPERLAVSFIPSSFPIIGQGIPILAILVMITSYLQTKLMSPVSSSNQQTPGMGQAMNIYMPLLMGWISYSYSAGLALYFFAGNLVSIIQSAAMGSLDWRKLIPKMGSPTDSHT